MSHRSVRATRLERTRGLPGDQLIPDPSGSLTHAITIACPRREVWPWLAQMGAGSRAGWYSYDRIDNGGRRSSERIARDLQSIAVGTLVLGWAPAPHAAPAVTWAFVLEEVDQGRTRLIVRARGAQGYRFCGLPAWVSGAFIRLGHFRDGAKATARHRRTCRIAAIDGRRRTTARRRVTERSVPRQVWAIAPGVPESSRGVQRAP